jgi:zinc/manganese transport system permease protein
MSDWAFAIGEFPLDILLPALCAGLLVIATHVPLGTQVLQRGIIFIDLAIAQVAGLGANLVSMLLGPEASPLWIQSGAVLLALLAAWLLVLTERLSQRYQEPLIGIVFVLSATAVMLLLAKDPHGGQHLSDLLAGQILWMSPSQILYAALATAVILLAMHFLRQRRDAFYSVFAVAITVSVQLVGVYLVFATLIIPALSTVLLQQTRQRIWMGYLTAVIGYVLGLCGSAYFDLPTGPLVVWALACAGLFSALVIRGRCR